MKNYKSIQIIFIVLILLSFSCPDLVFAKRKRLNNEWGTGSNPNRTQVNGYYKRNGTYVESHSRSKMNKTEYDNWSTRGNFNIYTGKRGTRSPRW